MASLPIVDKWMSGLSNYKINKAGGELCGKAPCILLIATCAVCGAVSRLIIDWRRRQDSRVTTPSWLQNTPAKHLSFIRYLM